MTTEPRTMTAKDKLQQFAKGYLAGKKSSTPPREEEWEKAFRKLMFDELGVSSEVDQWMKILLPFIREVVKEETEKAKAEERERCIKVIQSIENEEVNKVVNLGGSGMVGRTWVATDQVIEALTHPNKENL